ncbi:restriction endonuclease subunit S [Corynebacterium variabile]|uniref:restriction endonuclease subunit S n=1 Tax=Corynebacterium variabile TaxID=1727 RepID=UPI0028AB6927|nr:restriction endonuclease subunit S [Corynebacterium variabile]
MSARKAAAGDGPYPLPEGWRWVKLGEVAEINPRDPKLAEEAEISFVGMAQLDATTASAKPLETRSFSEVSKGYTVFRNHDVLVAKITPCWENGKIGQAELDHEVGVGSTEFHVVRPGGQLDSRYILHFLRQSHVRATGELRMTGSAGQRRVPAKYLSDLKIPLAPLSEQRRIAEILDVCGYLREKSEESQTELLNLEKEAYLKFFNREQLLRNGVKFSNLGDVTDIVTGNTPPRSDGDNYGGELEWVKSNNLGVRTAERASEFLTHLGEKKARVAPAGSVLVTCIAGSRNSIGKCSLLDRKVAFNQQINSVTPRRELTSEFVYGFFNSNPEAVREKSTGGMKGLVSKSEFSSISIPVPSLEMQNDYACHVRHIFQCQEEVKEMEERCRELVSSVEYKAFRGEL